MELQRIKLLSRFRSLQPGFTISFRKATGGHRIEPKCLVGLNGSGKSNVLELISEIFFYLEAAYHPEGKEYVDPKAPFGFKIDYQIQVTVDNLLTVDNKEIQAMIGNIRNVKIVKNPLEEPIIEFYTDGEDDKKIRFPENEKDEFRTLLDKLLPDVIVSYSSGQNELLSNPFLRMNAFYYDQYFHSSEQQEEGEEDNELQFQKLKLNRLFNMSYDSNASVLVCNYLMKDFESEDQPENVQGEIQKNELDYLSKVIGVEDLYSFKIDISTTIQKTSVEDIVEEFNSFTDPSGAYSNNDIKRALYKTIEFPPDINLFIDGLFQLATAKEQWKDESGNPNKWTLDFIVDSEMKRGFRNQFPGGALKLFQYFYFLDILNYFSYSNEVRERVKKAELGDNVSDMLYTIPEENKVFAIKDVAFRKLKPEEDKWDMLYYKSLSDGEHQYLQMIGTAMLMERSNALFLFDEPDTHFNPDWRSTLIRTYNEIIALKAKRLKTDLFDSQNVFITTHSPFIISDCFRTNVLKLVKDKTTQDVDYSLLPFETYGASINNLMKDVFEKKDTIADLSKTEIDNLMKEVKKKSDVQIVKEKSKRLGDSIEKVLLFNYLNSIEKDLPD